MALGDVVVLPPELGFAVTTDRENSAVERSKFVARIESRLQNVRALYRQQSEKDGALMGVITLQLNVGAMGDVTQVKEVASRIADDEFKKSVLAEAGNWSFEELVTESVTILCPLLFVREGMDITTLVEWEKSLSAVNAKAIVAPPTKNSKVTPQPKVAATPVAKQPSVRPLSAVAVPVSPAADDAAEAIYQMKYASSLRKAPNFSAPPVTRLPVGTKVAVVNSRGEWLEIRAADSGYAGFVRKEFITSAESARKR
jgi:hypothetical protein